MQEPMMSGGDAPTMASDSIPQVAALMELHTSTAAYMRAAIYGIQRFQGHPGQLRQFCRLADFYYNKILERVACGAITAMEAAELKVDIVTRIDQVVLTKIKGDPLEDWVNIKKKLEDQFGGGRWSVEEDILALLRQDKRQDQSAGDFAERLWERYERLRMKILESLPEAQATAKLQFVEPLVRALLRQEVEGGATAPPDEFEALAQWTWAKEQRERERWERRGEERRRFPYLTVETPRERRRAREVPPARRTPPRREEQRRREGRRTPPAHREPGRRDRNDRREVTCFKCNRRGHFAYQCPTLRCYECDEVGHRAKQCPLMFKRTGQTPMEVNLADLRQRRRQAERRRARQAVASETGSASDSDTTGTTSSGTTPGHRRRGPSRTDAWTGGRSGADVVKGKSPLKY